MNRRTWLQACLALLALKKELPKAYSSVKEMMQDITIRNVEWDCTVSWRSYERDGTQC